MLMTIMVGIHIPRWIRCFISKKDLHEMNNETIKEKKRYKKSK